MALFSYIQRTQQLLNDVKQELVNPAFLVSYINTARGQLAGEAQCIRTQAQLATAFSQRDYNFADFNIGVPATTGRQGIIHMRAMQYIVGGGQLIWVQPRNWEWFELYGLNNPLFQPGAPQMWAQYAQGSAGTGTGSTGGGSISIDPPPDTVYNLYCDCVCYPIALVDDTTVEAIPYLWTDCIPYFAAYLAYMTLQNREAAKAMMDLYTSFLARAREAANPSVNRWLYQQSPDPTLVAKLGLQQKNAE